MSYTDNKQPFLKIKNGVKAPAGFHYMPNGKLMSDADHIAMFGYIENKVKNISVDTTDVSVFGENRSFSITTDAGAILSIEIYEGNNYYNFKNKLFENKSNRLEKVESNGTYNFSVKFPNNEGGSLKTYYLNIYAETAFNIKTKHADHIEAVFPDGTIDLNNSVGSKSDIVQKILYQDTVKGMRLSCVAPSLYLTSTSTVNGATSSSNRIVVDGQTLADNAHLYAIGDKVTGTGIAASVHAIITKIDPDNDNANEFEISVTDSATNDDTLTFTPPFNGMTPHYTESTTGSFISSSLASGKNTKLKFTITCTALSGRTFSVIKTPTIEDLCAVKLVTFGASANAIEGENTSSDTVFHRFPVTNIAGLREGMVLDPARSGTGANTTHKARISEYRTNVTIQEIVENKYYTDFKDIEIQDVYKPGVDPLHNDVSTIDRTGAVTAQAGNITFDTQQVDALKADSNVRIFGYGSENIEAITGAKVYLSDITLTPTQVSTTLESASSNSTTLVVTEAGNISVGMTVRGVGIDASAANPTVVSKSVATGSANVVVSAAQTLESGQTIFFDGASNVVTITGTLEIEKMAISDTVLYFDVERFLTAQ